MGEKFSESVKVIKSNKLGNIETDTQEIQKIIKKTTVKKVSQKKTKTPERKNGHVDGILLQDGRVYIKGWAVSGDDEKVLLDIYLNDSLDQTILSDSYRKDLETGGIGDGRYGFMVEIPKEIAQNKENHIEIKFHDTDKYLAGSPLIYKHKPKYIFDIYQVSKKAVDGWIFDENFKNRPLTLKLYINDKFIMQTENSNASKEVESMYEVSHVGFHFDIPKKYHALKNLNINVKPEGNGEPIDLMKGITLASSNVGMDIVSESIEREKDAMQKKIRGNIDSVVIEKRKLQLKGWAATSKSKQIDLDIYINGEYDQKVLANQYREDLEEKRVGDGKHAFRVELSPMLDYDNEIKIEVKKHGEERVLPGSPFSYSHKSKYNLGIEKVNNSVVTGWFMDEKLPQRQLHLDLYIDGIYVMSSDNTLENEKMETKYDIAHGGFQFVIPEAFQKLKSLNIDLKVQKGVECVELLDKPVVVKTLDEIIAEELTDAEKIVSKKNAVIEEIEKKSRPEYFDFDFYSIFYDDIKKFTYQKAFKHWMLYGKGEGRAANFVELCKQRGCPYVNLPQIDREVFAKLNPLLATLSINEIMIKAIQLKEIELIRLTDNSKKDADYYLKLAIYYLSQNQADKAQALLLYSNYLLPSAKAMELLGNYYLDRGQKRRAIRYYSNALTTVEENSSIWLYINLTRILLGENRFEEVIETLKKGLDLLPQESQLLNLLDETVDKIWEYEQDELYALSGLNEREKLLEKAESLVHTISHAYASAFDDVQPGVVQKGSINPERVLIVGDFHIAQCIRYRIDQKVEQLELAGYEVTILPWTEVGVSPEELMFHDIVIFYRVPAFPKIIKMMEKAKSLGKVTFYEIDDLLFDPIYPPPYETYGGNIGIEEYEGLTYGMALFRAAAGLCEYAIASTQPLLDKLQPLVLSGKGFIHRNGLDSKNVFMLKAKKKYINIFYGSGTLAHNSDFLDLALGAIERVLQENSNVKLTIVGHLNLPEQFISDYGEQINIQPKTSTIEHYWTLLSGADINLAVLEKETINDCKSELKWFEAACFRIPSVVSNTQNYLDVIRDGEDALIASTEEEWYVALNRLIKDEKLRLAIGDVASERIRKEYSVESLSKNITYIIESCIASEGEKND